MPETFDIEVLRRNLAQIMDRRGSKPTTLSLKVGKSPTLVKDLLEKTSDTRLSTVYKLASELGVDAEDLLRADISPAPAGPRLFVKGAVAAGEWVEAYEWSREDWQAVTGRPDLAISPEHRFFLRVDGDSMDEVYPSGTFVECVSVFAEPEIVSGKRVIVVRHRHDGMIEATVKQYVEMDGRPWLVPQSSNPAHQAFPIDEPGEGIDEVRIIGLVVSSVRPE